MRVSQSTGMDFGCAVRLPLKHIENCADCNPGANEMDGVIGLTQAPTGPSKSFTYKFHVDEAQAGSFWYTVCARHISKY
jgi:hypothetical protein